MPKIIGTSKKVIALGGILALVVSLFVTIAVLRNTPGDSQVVHSRVRQEFQSFVPPPDSVLVQNSDISNVYGGLVGADYTSNRTFNDVRQYYEKQLVDRGYTFREFKPLTSWGVDYGEQVLHYCKGHMMAGLYTPGNLPTKTKFQFSFSISANGFECR